MEYFANTPGLLPKELPEEAAEKQEW